MPGISGLQVNRCIPGEVHNRYVPQSILDANGIILDVDIVLNEVFSDGAELSVEYSDGPLAFQARCVRP